MTHAPHPHTVAQDALKGFIVTGLDRGDREAMPTAIPVLAGSADEAMRCSQRDTPTFTAGGYMSEADLQDQLTSLAQLHGQQRSKTTGFIVAGYKHTDAIQRMRLLPVLADKDDDAIRLIHAQEPDFQPVGCLSEFNVRTFLQMIQGLRGNPMRTRIETTRASSSA